MIQKYENIKTALEKLAMSKELTPLQKHKKRKEVGKALQRTGAAGLATAVFLDGLTAPAPGEVVKSPKLERNFKYLRRGMKGLGVLGAGGLAYGTYLRSRRKPKGLKKVSHLIRNK